MKTKGLQSTESLVAPYKIASLYAVFGSLWILFSDRILERMAGDTHTLSRLQTLKGWLYVGFTAVILFFLIRRSIALIKRSQHALIESEKRYRTLVESTWDAIVLLDRNRTFRSCNHAFLELSGYAREEVQGRSVEIIHPSREHYEDFKTAFIPVVEKSHWVRTEWEIRRKDGKIVPVEVTYSSVIDEQGGIEGYVGIIRDISERKKTEDELNQYRNHLEEMVRDRTRELEAAQKALIQEEKLKILGAISAGIAHEIRNPLMAIGGFAKRLQKKSADAYETGIILQEATRLEKLLDRIEAYLKPVEMRPRGCSINALLEEVVALYSPELHQHQVEIDMSLAPDLSAALVDPDLLSQIFLLVLRGAAGNVDKGSRILIKSYGSEEHVQVVFVCMITQPKVKDINMLLLPFDEDTHDQGLAVSYRILQNMGGTFSLTRNEAEVNLTFSLPKAPPSFTTSSTPAASP